MLYHVSNLEMKAILARTSAKVTQTVQQTQSCLVQISVLLMAAIINDFVRSKNHDRVSLLFTATHPGAG